MALDIARGVPTQLTGWSKGWNWRPNAALLNHGKSIA
jgi:hypothetical protein